MQAEPGHVQKSDGHPHDALEEVDVVTRRMFGVMDRSDKPVLSLMERSEKEDELADWFDEHGVENRDGTGRKLCGMWIQHRRPRLFCRAHQRRGFAGAQLGKQQPRDGKNGGRHQETSQRISDLVALGKKLYPHGPRCEDKQFSDIRMGIRNTLTMLSRKIRKGTLRWWKTLVRRLPQVKRSSAGLNQVWTNLIDKRALDAMEENKRGRLEIKTEHDKGVCEKSPSSMTAERHFGGRSGQNL